MIPAIWKTNDKKARLLIGSFSVIVFAAVVLLSRIKLDVNLGFDVHYFAAVNAMLNSAVALLLVLALVSVKGGKYLLHRNLMLFAMVLSISTAFPSGYFKAACR